MALMMTRWSALPVALPAVFLAWKDRLLDLFGVRQAPYLARRSYHFEMRHILAWGIVAGMVEGNLAAVVVAKTFGGGDFLINVAATTPVAAHLASLFWGTLCIGRPKIRLFTIATAGVAMLVATAALTPRSPLGAWLFVAQMAAAQFFMSGVVTVRSAVWKSNYPQHVRGRISARLQIARSFTRLSAVAVAASLFDANPDRYRWVYPAAAFAGAVSILFLRRVRVRGDRSEVARAERESAGGSARATVARSSLRQAFTPRHVLAGGWRVLREDRRFRRYCLAQMMSGFANLTIRSVVVTIIARRLLGDVPGDYWISAVLLEVMPMLLLLIAMPRFARYYDRVGVVRFRVVHSICWLCALMLGLAGTLVVVHEERIGPWYFLAAVGLFAGFALMRGVCYAGGSIAWNLGHLHFARSAEAEVYMGIHVSLTGLRGLVLPTLGIALWATVGWGVWIISAFFSAAAIVSFRAMDRLERAEGGVELTR